MVVAIFLLTKFFEADVWKSLAADAGAQLGPDDLSVAGVAVEPEDPFQEAADGHQGHGEVDSGQHHCNGGWMELVGCEEGGRFSFGYLLSCKGTKSIENFVLNILRIFYSSNFLA